MRLVGKIIFVGILVVLVAGLTVWSGLALWFRLPMVETARMIAAGGVGLLGLTTLAAQFGKRPTRSLAMFAFAMALIFMWWASIKPPADGNWAPDVARQVTGEIDGDILTLNDVRAFEWRSEDDKTQNWVQRSYDLSTLNGVDLFLSHWDGPEIAHFIVSFGFQDGRYLAWSVEVRREVDGGFSPLADFFKTNTLVLVAAEERDVVGVRSNIRGEDVQLYRLNTSPLVARTLLEEYVRDANMLAAQPQFYNSVTTNCTTTVFRMVRAIGVNIPLDWRLILNGYLPDFAYDQGALDTRVPMEELRALSHIDERAQAVGLTEGYSKAIRVGVPTPER